MNDNDVLVWAERIWDQIVQKVEKTSLRIGDSFPYASIDGQYNDEPEDWWTNGFWPGLLWLIYRETNNQRLMELAVSCENKLDKPLQEYIPLHHDVGFMWCLSSVAHYKLLASDESRRRALTAASHLAGRFNPKGRFIRAWNQPERTGWAIIDCMMNLSLLNWASEETGDPRFKHIAMEYADTVLREFIRPDGSVHHIVCFNPETGERKEALGGQGYSPDSAWARGASWALYGMAISARYTRETRYLDAARKVAAFFLSNLPEDGAPPWDFRAPKEEAALDTTASACAASGLLEISCLVPASEASYYYRAGATIIKSLHEHYSTFDDHNEEGLLRMGTANYPKRHYVNVPIIYGDYFFAEAICKLRGKTDTFW